MGHRTTRTWTHPVKSVRAGYVVKALFTSHVHRHEYDGCRVVVERCRVQPPTPTCVYSRDLAACPRRQHILDPPPHRYCPQCRLATGESSIVRGLNEAGRLTTPFAHRHGITAHSPGSDTTASRIPLVALARLYHFLRR